MKLKFNKMKTKLKLLINLYFCKLYNLKNLLKFQYILKMLIPIKNVELII